MKIFATLGRRLTAADPGASEPEPTVERSGLPQRFEAVGEALASGSGRHRRLFRRRPGAGPRRGVRRGGARGLRATWRGVTGDDPSYDVVVGAAHGLERDHAGLPPPALLRGPAHRAGQPGPPAQPALGALPPRRRRDGRRHRRLRPRGLRDAVRRRPVRRAGRPLHPRDALARSGELARTVFARDETVARLGMRRRGDPDPARRPARTAGPGAAHPARRHRAARPRCGCGSRGSRSTDAVAGMLLDELARG